MVTLVWGGGEGVLGEGSPPPPPSYLSKTRGEGGWAGKGGWGDVREGGGIAGCWGGYCRVGGGVPTWSYPSHRRDHYLSNPPWGGGGDLIRLNEID